MFIYRVYISALYISLTCLTSESGSRPVTRAPVGIRADDDVFVWTPGAAGVGGAVVGAEGGAECMSIDAYV